MENRFKYSLSFLFALTSSCGLEKFSKLSDGSVSQQESSVFELQLPNESIFDLKYDDERQSAFVICKDSAFEFDFATRELYRMPKMGNRFLDSQSSKFLLTGDYSKFFVIDAESRAVLRSEIQNQKYANERDAIVLASEHLVIARVERDSLILNVQKLNSDEEPFEQTLRIDEEIKRASIYLAKSVENDQFYVAIADEKEHRSVTLQVQYSVEKRHFTIEQKKEIEGRIRGVWEIPDPKRLFFKVQKDPSQGDNFYTLSALPLDVALDSGPREFYSGHGMVYWAPSVGTEVLVPASGEDLSISLWNLKTLSKINTKQYRIQYPVDSKVGVLKLGAADPLEYHSNDQIEVIVSSKRDKVFILPHDRKGFFEASINHFRK